MKRHVITWLVFLLIWGALAGLWYLGYANPYDSKWTAGDTGSVTFGLGGLIWLYYRYA